MSLSDCLSLLRFGYCDDLHLAWHQLVAPVLPTPGSPVELSSAGLEFLNNLFTKHDLDHDGNLSSQEMISLFSTCPGNNRETELNVRKTITVALRVNTSVMVRST